jgi:hypothetical protein
VVASQHSEDARNRMKRAVDAYRAFYEVGLVLPKLADLRKFRLKKYGNKQFHTFLQKAQ